MLAQGHDPLAALICTREGSADPSFKTTIGYIAKLTVREADSVGPIFVKYDGERLAGLKGTLGIVAKVTVTENDNAGTSNCEIRRGYNL